jgi:CubicO group peptidase (beta-lactamase class C family)
MLSKVSGYFAIVSISLVMASAKPKHSGNNDPGFQEIDAYLKSLIDSGGIPGIAVGITNGSEIVYKKCFGVTSVQTKQKLEPSHIFHIASISKTFAATAIMQLHEKGKLDINKTLISYLPYFKFADNRYKKITIKQMLNHTSGMPDVEDYEWEKGTSDEGAAERYTRSLVDNKLISEPGAEFHYSNMAFDITADVIAKVSGMPFERYVKQNILDPLEMYESSFYFPDTKKSLRTSPHIGNPPTVSVVYPYNRMHAPSSTLNTSILELAHWAIANINGGKYKATRILSPATHAMMMSPTFTIDAAEKRAIGLSWFMYPYLGTLSYEHGGSDLGYRSMLTLIPAKKLGIIILCNLSQMPISNVRNTIREILLSKYKTIDDARMPQLEAIPQLYL